MSESTLFFRLFSQVKPNTSVLFTWQGASVPNNFQETVERIQNIVGDSPKVSVEHVERIASSNHQKSTFDMIITNCLTPEQTTSNAKALQTYLGLLKPNGKYIEFGKSEVTSLESELKLSGFKNVGVDVMDGVGFYQAEKPTFEVGSASKLKFAKAKTTEASTEKKVWKFTDDDINEDDLINTDDLLDDLDLKKPTIEVRDCGTSKEGKKKACKNCSCGLAEEIESEATGKIQANKATAAKSACGSCYLGDAFRCASCPYLGMPAFKAGEKVEISETLLKADI